MAVSTIANQIRNGEIEVGLALGYEHMTAKWVISIPLIFTSGDTTD
jgi:acetyl-CoA acetyltransferase